jgi:hypothetical protein
VFFKPTVETENKEGVFLPDEPTELITHEKFQKVPFLTGVNSSEGLLCLRGNVFVDTHLVVVMKYSVLDSHHSSSELCSQYLSQCLVSTYCYIKQNDFPQYKNIFTT